MSELERRPEPAPNEDDSKPQVYSKGDLLHPEWGERPPWFGYIGVGIAVAAMLVGITLMIVGGLFAWRWIGS